MKHEKNTKKSHINSDKTCHLKTPNTSLFGDQRILARPRQSLCQQKMKNVTL
jgi:hypothetical protein